MAIEIERKFLVVGEAWRGNVERSLPMRQGYLSSAGGRASVRVRIEGEVARLNIKAAVVGAARAEYDYAVPVSDAEEILGTLCVGVLEKVRHFVTHRGHVWEIDEFGGANSGLIVAELELTRVDEAFVRPPWLGTEVTDDRRYYNQHLATHPFCDWTRS